MRSYGQYCGLAKALDVVGDRWTLLIVRELLIRGACRYTDLLAGLPGVATNLLADRLRELEGAGLVRREMAPPPVATTLFHLTPRGQELEPALHALGRWGGPLVAMPAKGDRFRTHWLALPVRIHLRDHTPEAQPVAIEVRAGGESLTIEAREGAIHTRLGAPAEPDAVMAGPPHLIVGVLLNRIGLDSARSGGLRIEGKLEALRRVQPKRAEPARASPRRG